MPLCLFTSVHFCRFFQQERHAAVPPHGEMIWLDIWLGFAALKHAHSVLEEFEILIDCCWRRAAVKFGLPYL